jgi:hypothetical protein
MMPTVSDEPPVGGTLIVLNVNHFRDGRFTVMMLCNGLATTQGDETGKRLAEILRTQADAIDPPNGIIKAKNLPSDGRLN